MPWRLNIRDKIELPLTEKHFCPSHYVPHTIPLIDHTIDLESCHVYKNQRMLLHIAHCLWLECPNLRRMMAFCYQTFPK